MNGRVIPLSTTHEELYSGERAHRIPYHRMYEKEYCTTVMIGFSTEEMNELRQASERVHRVFEKGLHFAQENLPNWVMTKLLGLHPALIAPARVKLPFTGITRQDWLLTKDGWKLIENNTDTPTGIPETGFLTGSILEEFPLGGNPSSEMFSLLGRTLLDFVQYYRSSGLHGRIVFSSYDWHIEDQTNTLYLLEALRSKGIEAEYIPIEQLEVVPDDGLYAGGERISIWYRLYPLEYLIHDEDDAGYASGQAILTLVEQGKLGLINPVQNIIMQSKGFLAWLWSLYELDEDLWSPEDLHTIQNYFLPTDWSSDRFVREAKPFVSKSMFGREGKGTVLHDARGGEELVEWGVENEEWSETRRYYGEQPKIFQQRVETEAVTIPTKAGSYDGHLLTGVYVLNGAFAGILPRVGGKITGDLAYYCPAVVR
jgi:glutathionylspermidine synthase